MSATVKQLTPDDIQKAENRLHGPHRQVFQEMLNRASNHRKFYDYLEKVGHQEARYVMQKAFPCRSLSPMHLRMYGFRQNPC